MSFITEEDFIESLRGTDRDGYDSSSISDTLKNQLNYFANRRQIDKFHSWLFKCYHQMDVSFDDYHHFVPQSFRLIYGESIIKAPPLQTIQIWKLFLDETNFHSPIVLELFICFLSHLRICDDLVPKMVLPQEVACIEATRDKILNFQFTELRSHNELEMFLRFCYSWGNIILLKYFYGKDKPILEWSKYAWYDLAPIHNYYDSSVWKSIITQCLGKITELSEVILKLMVQKLSLLTKASYTERDHQVREITVNNARVVVIRLLSKIDKSPALLDCLDLWRLCSFVPDDLMNELTMIVIDDVVRSDDINPHLVTTITKGCEKSIFVLSLVESIIKRCKGDLNDHPKLTKLFDFSDQNRFFEDSTGNLNLDLTQRLEILMKKGYNKEIKVLFPSTSLTLKVLKILRYLPLEHLQGETQLKCSILLISLLFSADINSEVGKLAVEFMMPILQNNHTFWFFQVFPPSDLCLKLIRDACTKKIVHSYVSDFINAATTKYFNLPKVDGEAINSTIHSLYDSLRHAEPKTSLCLTTILLKNLSNSDLSSTDLQPKLIEDLLDLLVNSKSKIFSHDEVNGTLLVILEYFSKRDISSLEKRERKLFKSFVPICSRSIDDTCKSLVSPESVDTFNFKSNVKLLLFLCSTSKHLDQLLTPQKVRLVWSSLFPNYPEIDLDDHDDTDNILMIHDNNAEYFKAIPIISKCIFENVSETLLPDYVDYCFKVLSNQSKIKDKLLTLYIFKGLIDKEWNKSASRDSRLYQFTDQNLDKILHLVTSIILEQNSKQSFNIEMIQASCDLVKHILKAGKNLLTSPRLYCCLQICSFLPLQRSSKSPNEFSKVLSSFHSILNQFLLNYNYMAATSIVLIKDLLQNYLTTLTQVSDQSLFNSYDKKVQTELINGASDLNKLITQLTNDFVDDFAPFSPQLITCYVSLNHKFNIHPSVKQHLILCIYRLLNVIKSNENWKDIYDMIHCRLDESGRDLLKILYENYEKFYVFKGRF